MANSEGTPKCSLTHVIMWQALSPSAHMIPTLLHAFSSISRQDRFFNERYVFSVVGFSAVYCAGCVPTKTFAACGSHVPIVSKKSWCDHSKFPDLRKRTQRLTDDFERSIRLG